MSSKPLGRVTRRARLPRLSPGQTRIDSFFTQVKSPPVSVVLRESRTCESHTCALWDELLHMSLYDEELERLFPFAFSHDFVLQSPLPIAPLSNCKTGCEHSSWDGCEHSSWDGLLPERRPN